MSIIDNVMGTYVRRQVKKTGIIVPLPEDKKLVEGKLHEVPLSKGKCPLGTPTKTYLRKGQTNDLLIMFNGGGITWDADSCQYPLTFHDFFTGKTCLYSATMEEIAVFGAFLLPKEHGVIEADPRKNPFYNWNLAFLQYGTGDVHVGNGDYTFTNRKGARQTIPFNGYITVCEALDTAKKYFPDPDRIVIVGGSAGAFGCSILSGEVADRFPNCKNITMFCDSAMLIYDHWKDTVENMWKAPRYICDAIKTQDITADMLEALYQKYGERMKILYAQSVRDVILIKFQHYFETKKLKYDPQTADFMFKKLQERVERLKRTCPNIHYYFNKFPGGKEGGTEHCVCASKSWYSGVTDGVTPSAWPMRAVNGELSDVGMALLH